MDHWVGRGKWMKHPVRSLRTSSCWNNNHDINSIIAITKVEDDQFEGQTIMEYHRRVGYYLWHPILA